MKVELDDVQNARLKAIAEEYGFTANEAARWILVSGISCRHSELEHEKVRIAQAERLAEGDARR